MIRLSLQLTLRGGREAIMRLVVTALGVALGVAMLLITLSTINAVNAQNSRYAWLETSATPVAQSASGPLWWALSADEFRAQQIGRVDVAVAGAHAPVPPGIPRLPGPGQYYASPALSSLLHSVPAAQLADRYPGRQVGTIADSALPSAQSLIIVIGRTSHDLARDPQAVRVSAISATTPSSCNGDCFSIGINANGIDLVLAVATAALLFPIVVFIGAAARLSAARREQRFAAMRLVGATPRQITIVSTVESTVAALVGTLVGFLGFFAFRPAVANIPFTGSRFFLSDIVLNLPDVLVVALGVPVAAAVAARIALRRVTVSPLGVTRRVSPKPPRWWRLVPLVSGIAELWLVVVIGRPTTTPEQITVYMSGILTVMFGLVIAGPWLTMIGSRLMVRWAHRPSTLIAGRRLADNPQAGFRAVGGVVLALFVASVAISSITALEKSKGPNATDAAARATLVQDLVGFRPPGFELATRTIAAGVLRDLNRVPAVDAVTEVHVSAAVSGKFQPLHELVSCAALRRAPALGRCAPGARVAAPAGLFDSSENRIGTVWPSSPVSPQTLDSLPVEQLAITGSPAGVERARTLLERDFPHRFTPTTIAENYMMRRSTQLVAQYRRLVEVIVLASLPIAGCSLAVSVVAGIGERRRAFSLLRLSGTPLQVLRRVIALESAVPLLVLAALSIATGFLAAGLFLRSQLGERFNSPPLGFYLTVVLGLLASFAIIATTLPLLRRTTGPEVARND